MMTVPSQSAPKNSAAAALLVAGGAAWAAALMLSDSIWDGAAQGLLAAGVVILHTILSVATVLAPGRWIGVTAAVLLSGELGLALALPIGPWWLLAVVIGGAAVGLLWRRRVLEDIARMDRPDRVPPAATALVLTLIALPAVVGALGWNGVTLGGWVLATAGAVVGWMYMRALAPGLWAARLAIPVLAAWAAVGLEGVSAGLLVTYGGVITALAWTHHARVAASPITTRSSPVPILPELVPADVLERAGFDQRGRPRKPGTS